MAKRGRPKKTAAKKAAKKISKPVPEWVTKAEELKTETLPEPAHSPLPPKLEELSTAVADKILDGLKLYLPIVARLAAADTLRTSEKAETVLERAIKEGRLAAAIYAGQNETLAAAGKMKSALEEIAKYKEHTREDGEEWNDVAYRQSTLAREALGIEVAHG